MALDDLAEFLPAWQERSESTFPEGRPPMEPAYGSPGGFIGADSYLPLSVPPTPQMPGTMGPTGPTGPSGSAGAKGSQGITGIGPKGSQGTIGPSGPDGMRGINGFTGPTGTKSSIIRTPLGNVMFSCMESGRPLLLDVLTGKECIRLRERFVASIAPGSAFVLAIHPANFGADIDGERVLVDGEGEATVTVAGINRYFPEWDTPVVSDAVRERSRQFWRQEREGEGGGGKLGVES